MYHKNNSFLPSMVTLQTECSFCSWIVESLELCFVFVELMFLLTNTFRLRLEKKKKKTLLWPQKLRQSKQTNYSKTNIYSRLLTFESFSSNISDLVTIFIQIIVYIEMYVAVPAFDSWMISNFIGLKPISIYWSLYHYLVDLHICM